jgi:hypothetical protein
MKICRLVAAGDRFANIFQTRSEIDRSIYLEDAGGPTMDIMAKFKLEEKKISTSELLLMKDRMDVPLGYNRPDAEYGFDPNRLEVNTIARCQGMRTGVCVVALSRERRTEHWLAEQKGLAYVAMSRHTKMCIVSCSVTEFGEALNVELQSWHKVDGLLNKVSSDEHHHRPVKLIQSLRMQESEIMVKLMERGAVTQTGKFVAFGSIKEDWRPWPQSAPPEFEVARGCFKQTTDALNCATVPYAHSPAARLPIFKQAMGLHSLRRPFPSPVEYLQTDFHGLNRIAVPQTSNDEVLDLKNVVERTARPRTIAEDPLFIETHGERLWLAVRRCFLDADAEKMWSTEPSVLDWVKTRSPDFIRKYMTSDPYGLTSQSVRSNGFLKTQVKVKLDPEFAMEENYGQTVLASPPDFNAIFGPYSKMFLRNVRLGTRFGVILDSGYSDKDVAREWRQAGILPRFADENHQADVSRQDTSHTPVTLRVFRKAMVYFGVPDELAALYELHSRAYQYSSMKTQLYKGTAKYNLGSGDPFTLIRNIFEVLTVFVERFDNDDLARTNCIVKGDDYLGDRIPRRIVSTVPEIRETVLKEAFNAPPYHAGRFFLSDDIVPDPLRMIAKVATKPCNTVERYQQLQQSFYDRYVPLGPRAWSEMKHYLPVAYARFDSDFANSALELYRALIDRRHFAEIFSNFSQTDAGLYTLSRDGGCTSFALAACTILRNDVPEGLLDREYDLDDLRGVCARLSIPFYVVQGRPGDFTREGVWATYTHCWAVVDLIKFTKLHESQTINV